MENKCVPVIAYFITGHSVTDPFYFQILKLIRQKKKRGKVICPEDFPIY